MLRANPEIKIIVCMRNLVEEISHAFSQLKKNCYRRNLCFEEQLRNVTFSLIHLFGLDYTKVLLTRFLNIYLMALDELRKQNPNKCWLIYPHFFQKICLSG